MVKLSTIEIKKFCGFCDLFYGKVTKSINSFLKKDLGKYRKTFFCHYSIAKDIFTDIQLICLSILKFYKRFTVQYVITHIKTIKYRYIHKKNEPSLQINTT